MTTYTTIPDSDVDPESPVTTSLVTALRDNPIAITEGAAGAPSIAEAALATAVQNQLVTNGDSHNHVGGDGASLGSDAIIKTYTSGSQNVTAGAPWVISPAGFYNIAIDTGLVIEINVSGTWRIMSAGANEGSFVISDGTNMRVRSLSGTVTTYYQQFD